MRETPRCNLLVTYDVQHRDFARRNVASVLGRLGASPRFLEGAPPGVFELYLPTQDVRPIVEQARVMCKEDPFGFAHTHHWRPVDAWTPAEEGSMARAVRNLASGIEQDETWRLTAQVHGPSDLHAQDLVKPLTDPVRRGVVRLENPAKEVRVDVLGPKAAIALLARGEELSVDQVRREMAAMPQDV